MFGERAARLRAASTTTPGRFGLIGVGLVLLIALIGLVTAVGVAQRTAAMNHLVDASEPRATAALQVYGALSDADAMASRAFLSSEQEPPEVRQQVRQRYDNAIRQAQTSLAVAARGAAAETAGPITELATQLPVYVGLVETARANNRQGFPVGAAYLRDASNQVMRDRLLPAARKLREIEARNQAADVAAADGFPYVLVLLGLVLLVGLVAAQWYVTKRTNRLLNIGMIAATGAVVAWSLWLIFAVSNQVGGLQDSVRRGSAQTDVLAQARVTAREAKAVETLTLILREGRTEDEPFTKAMEELGDAEGGLLARAREQVTDAPVGSKVNSAIQNAQAWQQVHKQIREHDVRGEYKEAVDLAILLDNKDSADSVFGRLEGNLNEAYDAAERAFKDEARAARNATIGLVAGIVALTIVAIAGCAWGMWQRFREYL